MRFLLFDIDGTLLVTEGGGKNAFAKAISEEFGIPKTRIEIDFSGRTDRSLLTELLVSNQLEPSEDNQRRLLRRYTQHFPAVLAECGGRVLPGVIELLEEISGHEHLHSYVMTGNLMETARHKLTHFGLLDFFRGIYGGDHDPHRDELARRTAAALRQEHGDDYVKELVVIGDTPDDIRCGHAIGAEVIAVCTGRHSRAELEAENPEAVLDDFSDIAEIQRLLV